jgi:site-specific recombinase XerD
MAQPIPRSSLLRSFRRHLEAENRSERTLASYLQSVRQAEAFLASRGKRLEEASRADLEAFLGDLLRRRAPATRCCASCTAGWRKRRRSRPTRCPQR